MFSGKCLKNRRESMRLSQAEIAIQLGINRSSYNSWESGRAKPNQKNLLLLSKILDVEPSYFESEYHIVNNYLQLNEVNQTLADEFVEGLLEKQLEEEQLAKVVPLFAVEVLDDIELSAGPGQGYFDEYATKTVYSDEEHSGYDIATWISGTSMEPVYPDGDVALIRATGFDYDGAVYALSWNGSVYIKKLYREEEGFRMVSINKAKNPERFIPYEDEPIIVGKIVGHFTPVTEVD
ncbi:TPA: helix-turn-helix transcriptional regulator [Streptococcus suis]|nr:helix-turn-helix transcriptional regulator [Streptococcus suis]NQI92730.1 helix-turn-helix transcriptional regulator [Streptococcus suis]NQJ00579.1 helix-turn-helix transcriptional regulator [Streptococcus suis]HEM4248689.1 helix-turn-helix transcriptional regulator [Streptococcus suis]HEM4403672.1 helix-turn-helix transcriptional regulator [Streptococcus suis]